MGAIGTYCKGLVVDACCLHLCYQVRMAEFWAPRLVDALQEMLADTSKPHEISLGEKSESLVYVQNNRRKPPVPV